MQNSLSQVAERAKCIERIKLQVKPPPNQLAYENAKQCSCQLNYRCEIPGSLPEIKMTITKHTLPKMRNASSMPMPVTFHFISSESSYITYSQPNPNLLRRNARYYNIEIRKKRRGETGMGKYNAIHVIWRGKICVNTLLEIALMVGIWWEFYPGKIDVNRMRRC